MPAPLTYLLVSGSSQSQPSAETGTHIPSSPDALISTENGPALWLAILAPIRAAYGSGVIAGGAVRDYHLGFIPRDIDVFVDVETREELVAGIEALGPRFGVAVMTPADLAEYETAPDWKYEVRGVLDGWFTTHDRAPGDWEDNQVHVQIVARPMPGFSGEVLSERFDLGITRSWFDGQFGDTPAAAKDRADKTLTLMRWDTDAHVARSVDRARRFIGRYPDFTFVGPRLGDGAGHCTASAKSDA